jgi:predicted RNA-binding protein with RPS1 domain
MIFLKIDEGKAILCYGREWRQQVWCTVTSHDTLLRAWMTSSLVHSDIAWYFVTGVNDVNKFGAQSHCKILCYGREWRQQVWCTVTSHDTLLRAWMTSTSLVHSDIAWYFVTGVNDVNKFGAQLHRMILCYGREWRQQVRCTVTSHDTL